MIFAGGGAGFFVVAGGFIATGAFVTIGNGFKEVEGALDSSGGRYVGACVVTLAGVCVGLAGCVTFEVGLGRAGDGKVTKGFS